MSSILAAILALSPTHGQPSATQAPGAQAADSKVVSISHRMSWEGESADGGSRTRTWRWKAPCDAFFWLIATAKGSPPTIELRAADGTILARDRGSGGLGRSTIEGDVSSGQELVVEVEPADPDHPGVIDLELELAPETTSSRNVRDRIAGWKAERAAAFASGDIAAADRALSEFELAVASEPDLASSAAATEAALQFVTDDPLANLDAPKQRVFEHWLAVHSTMLPSDHDRVIRVRLLLADSEPSPAAAARRCEVLEAETQRLLAGRDESDPELALAQRRLAWACHDAGDSKRGRDLLEQVVASQSRTRSAADPVLVDMELTLAGLRLACGEAERAQREVEAITKDALPAVDRRSSLHERAWFQLSTLRYRSGDVEGARVAMERALVAAADAYAPWHPRRIEVELGASNLFLLVGDPGRAREIALRTIENCEAKLPDDHPVMLNVRRKLSSVLAWIGDWRGARIQCERLHTALERTRPTGDPELLELRIQFARTLRKTGSSRSALELLAQSLEEADGSLPPDSPIVTRLMLEYGETTCITTRSLAASAPMLEQALARLEHEPEADPDDLLSARLHLAQVRMGYLRFDDARALLDEVARELSTRPDAYVSWRESAEKLRLCLCMLAGDVGGARASVEALAGLADQMVRQAVLEASPREAESRVAELREDFEILLGAVVGAPDQEARRARLERVFPVIEAARGAALRATRRRRTEPDGSRAEVERLRSVVASLSRSLADGARSGLAREDFENLAAAKDGAEWSLRHASEKAGVAGEAPRLDAGSLSAALPKGTAAIAWLRARVPRDWRKFAFSRTDLLAFVLRPDAPIELVELGEAARIDELVRKWRQETVGSDGRGAAPAKDRPDVAPGPERSTEDVGLELRRAVFDPLRPLLEGSTRLVLVPDEPLFAVPLDALPDGGARPVSYTHLTLPTILRV